MICTIEGCDRPVAGRGYCGKHWQRWRKYGDPNVLIGPAAKVFAGERYGRLVVVAYAGNNRHQQRQYTARCDCGVEIVVNGYALTNGNTQSCGCLQRERFTNRTHGLTGTPEYRVWKNMNQRCANPNGDDWERYGGRGITVCERWRNSFEAFLADMGPMPGPGYSIDREDSRGNYEPANCRWITISENSRRAHLGKPHCGGNYHA